MLLLVRLRSLLTRHRSIYWMAVAAAVAVTASAAWSATARLETAREAWTERRTVWVATEHALAGGVLTVTARELPVGAIPDDAVADRPVDAIAAQRVGRGEVVTTADLGDGVLSMLPQGWRAIAMSTDPAPPPAQPGHHVCVYADGELLADLGVVLAVTDGVVTVGVPDAAAAAVSMAARNQTAVLALRRP